MDRCPYGKENRKISKNQLTKRGGFGIVTERFGEALGQKGKGQAAAGVSEKVLDKSGDMW